MQQTYNSALGSIVGIDLSPSAMAIQSLTLPSQQNQTASQQQVIQSVQSTGSTNTPAAFFGEPLAVWIGMIAVLIVLKWLSERKNQSMLNPADLRISGYNVLAVTVTAMVGFIGLKVLFNRVQIPGVTAFVNAA